MATVRASTVARTPLVLGVVPLLMCGLVILRRWWVLRKMGAGPAADAAGIIPVLLATL